MHLALIVNESHGFEGIITDSGANRSPIMSISQYRLYCEEYGVVPNFDASRKRPIQGIGGRKVNIGCAILPIPLKGIGTTIMVNFQITDENVPSLRSQL
jgi:hypothetical protein